MVQEQAAAETEVTDALKFALVKGWSLSQIKAPDVQPMRPKTVCVRPPGKGKKNRSQNQKKETEKSQDDLDVAVFYEPNVPDLSKVGMGVELLVSHIPIIHVSVSCHCTCCSIVQSLAERMAENAHNRWALQLKNKQGTMLY